MKSSPVPWFTPHGSAHDADGAAGDRVTPDVGHGLVRLQRLDRAAWTALYLEHRRLVRGIVAGHVGYGPELEDLTQQVFTTAATLVRDGKVVLRGDGPGLRAWLAAIAHRVGLAARRRRGGAPRDASEEAFGTQPHVDPEAREVLQHAREVWTKLPERLQAVWLLRRLERMTIDEVAAALGISPATAKRRMADAERRFEALAWRDPVLREYLQFGERT